MTKPVRKNGVGLILKEFARRSHEERTGDQSAKCAAARAPRCEKGYSERNDD